MRKYMVALVTVAALAGAGPALATEPAAPSATAAPSETAASTSSAKKAGGIDDPNRMVCTRERVVGSNMPQKVCMTVAERDRLRDAAVDRGRNTRGQDYNTCIGGPGR